jgi:hypothetical protein
MAHAAPPFASAVTVDLVRSLVPPPHCSLHAP